MKHILKENMRRFGTKNIDTNQMTLNEKRNMLNENAFTVDDWTIAENPKKYLGNANLVDEWLQLFSDEPDSMTDDEYLSIANNFLEDVNSKYRCIKKISQNEEGEITWVMTKI